MSLKQSIVVKNEFTFKTGKSKGTRGGTPGSYVLRYMGRDLATEDLTPVQFDNESFIMRYMARKEATETASSIHDLKMKMRNAQGSGGVAFGYGDVSLSHQHLKDAAKDIQENFDKGKTVLKTVLSFDENYLRETGIIEPDFVLQNRGDYRGNVDQMKLRMAIMNGLKKLSEDYDDLQYIGVIQVDTKHLHCHLAMVDRGVGNMRYDGTQRGKITAQGKRKLRRGIDEFLDEKQHVKFMSSNITHDKRNALCFIKKYTHKVMDEHGMGQFLMACLPEDKRLWRASTNRKEMKKPNAIAREYVMQVLAQPDSGYREAMQHVHDYASYRQQREGLSAEEYQKLMYDGEHRIVNDCINGVYAVLKQIPDAERSVRTPMIDVMSMNYEDMASRLNDDDMIDFGFRLRSYSSRLDHHKKETHKYHEAVESFQASKNIDESAKPLLTFFQEEEEYNAKLMCKYQHFLSFLPPSEDYEEKFRKLMKYKGEIDGIGKLLGDASPKRMTAENAEDYGVRVYGVHGGRYLTFAPQMLERKQDIMQADFEKQQDEFARELADYGLTLDEKGISRKKPYEFDDVKALDIHHLGYDFAYDVPISRPNVEQFVDMANRRYLAFQNAKDYLVGSGQSAALHNFPEQDIKLMKEVADSMTVKPVLVSNTPLDSGQRRNTHTIRLDENYATNMELAVKSAISTIQFDEYGE